MAEQKMCGNCATEDCQIVVYIGQIVACPNKQIVRNKTKETTPN